jgi:hypothetical protein
MRRKKVRKSIIAEESKN